jgi:hypothetical protein
MRDRFSRLFAVALLAAIPLSASVYTYQGSPLDGPVWAGFVGGCPNVCVAAGWVEFSPGLPAGMGITHFDTTAPVNGISLLDFDFAVSSNSALYYRFTPATTVTADFWFRTDGSGHIDWWSASLFNSSVSWANDQGAALFLNLCGACSPPYDTLGGAPNNNYLQGSSQPGSWSEGGTAPEPAASLLLFGGLGALWRLRRTRHRDGLLAE